jgi:hypothetical protein
MSSDEDYHHGERKYTQGKLRAMLHAKLASRGVTVSQSERVNWAQVEECLDRDFAISPNGEHVVALHGGHPMQAVSFDTAMDQIANALAITLGGNAALIPATLEEVKARQKLSGLYGP